MADSQSIGNLLMIWLVPSLPVWAWIALRWPQHGQPLPLRPPAPWPWHGVGVSLAFPVTMLVHTVVLARFTESERLSVAYVQASCLARILESAILMAVLGLTAPIRDEDFGLDHKN